MSKVLVDRELLERAMYANDGKELIAANRELRAILAQPAEAEGVEVRCDICGGTGAADSGGIQPWGEAIYVDCECIAKQEQFSGKLGALKKAAKGACSYSEEDWFRPENLWSCMEKDDAAFVSAASPFALLALIAAYDRISAALSAVTAERDRLANAFGDCISSLHAEMLQKYGGQLPEDMHPVTRRDYVRDMEEIAEYRAAMAAKEAEPEHVCSGCGAKGWTGNCLECIPY